jgi:hypothetical protein
MITMGLFMVVFVVGLFGAIDAAVRPFDHWQQVNRSKAAWITVQILVLFPIADIVGLVGTVAYLTAVRPKLQAVAEGLPTT